MKITRRTALLGAAGGMIGGLPIPAFSTAVQPLRLFIYEVPLSHFDVSDAAHWRQSFEREMTYIRADARKHSDGNGFDQLKTCELLAYAKDQNISLRPIYYEVEPSAYFSDYRKIVYFARSIDPRQQGLLREFYDGFTLP